MFGLIQDKETALKEALRVSYDNGAHEVAATGSDKTLIEEKDAVFFLIAVRGSHPGSIVYQDDTYSREEMEELARFVNNVLSGASPGGVEFRSTKRCFAYCGDMRCTCRTSPFYPGNEHSFEGHMVKKKDCDEC